VLSPAFLVFLVAEFEFAPVRLVAQGVQSAIAGEIGFPMVGDEPVVAAGQNAPLVHGRSAALGRQALVDDFRGWTCLDFPESEGMIAYRPAAQ